MIYLCLSEQFSKEFRQPINPNIVKHTGMTWTIKAYQSSDEFRQPKSCPKVNNPPFVHSLKSDLIVSPVSCFQDFTLKETQNSGCRSLSPWMKLKQRWRPASLRVFCLRRCRQSRTTPKPLISRRKLQWYRASNSLQTSRR